MNQTKLKQKVSAAASSYLAPNLSLRLRELKKLRQAILEYEDKILAALARDLHKPAAEAYATEIGFCLHEISVQEKNLKRWIKPQKAKSCWFFPFSKSLIYQEPYGRVLIISPWNYPFGLAISPLVGALAAGNRVVVKPSEISGQTAAVIKEMLEKYFAPEAVQVVLGGVAKTQKLLAEKFDYIFFTGSATVGKIVMAAAAQNLTPLTLELGGKSPCLVDKNCDLDKTAARIVYGKFLNAGQTCVAPDYLFVHKEIKDELIKRLKMKITEFYGNDPSKSKDYGRIINTKHFNRLKNYLDDAKIIFGGETNEESLFISPTLIENNSLEGKIMEEEIFGPILPLISYSQIDEALNFINCRPKPLALYIFSNNKKFQDNILARTSSGGVCINDTVIQVANPSLPFGGVGSSGLGKYHGRASLDTFSNTKSVLKNTTWFEMPKRFPPFNNFALKILKKVLK